MQKQTNSNAKKTLKNKSKTTIQASKQKKEEEKRLSKNEFIMKLLVFLGVVIFSFILIYLMYHFFVQENNIKVNMSTDKKMEYTEILGTEKLIVTQKYVSDLNYSMRYNINEFKVFKYKNQDIYKAKKDERVVVVVEKSTMPANCSNSQHDTTYNSCYLNIDNFTEEYYLSRNNIVYKITIKKHTATSRELLDNIDFMIDNFAMID